MLDVLLFGAYVAIPAECVGDPCPGIADEVAPVLDWGFAVSFGATMVATLATVVAMMGARRYALALGGLLVLDVLFFGAGLFFVLASSLECDADGCPPRITDELASVFGWAFLISVGASVLAMVPTIAATVSTIRAKRSR